MEPRREPAPSRYTAPKAGVNLLAVCSPFELRIEQWPSRTERTWAIEASNRVGRSFAERLRPAPHTTRALRLSASTTHSINAHAAN